MDANSYTEIENEPSAAEDGANEGELAYSEWRERIVQELLGRVLDGNPAVAAVLSGRYVLGSERPDFGCCECGTQLPSGMILPTSVHLAWTHEGVDLDVVLNCVASHEKKAHGNDAPNKKSIV